MKKKILLITSIMSIILLTLISTSFAATGNIELTPSNKKVERGETFTIKINVSCDENIKAVEIKLDCDDCFIFNGYETSGEWGCLPDDDDYNLTFINRNENIKNAEVANLEFTVKDTAKANSSDGQTITFKNITIYYSEGEEDEEGQECKLAEKKLFFEIAESTSGKDDEEQQPGNNSEQQPENNAEQQPENTPENNTATDVPKTGATSTTIAIITLIGIATFSFVSYLRYKNV